ncbi:MAG: hypothetical protein ABIC04_02620 [Nanoarchaeota archaeon]
MLKLEGIIKKIEVEEYVKKDLTAGSKRWLYVERQHSIFPVTVEVTNNDLKLGKEGDKISIDVGIDAFYWESPKVRKKAKYKLYASKFN